MPECAKTHLQQSRISKFSGEDPGPPLQGEEREGYGRGRAKRREGERGRIGREGRDGKGQGRERGREGRNGGGVVGRGGALDMGSPLETSSGSAPALRYRTRDTLRLISGDRLPRLHDEIRANLACSCRGDRGKGDMRGKSDTAVLSQSVRNATLIVVHADALCRQ